jgi:hypothetical protein
MFAAALLFCLAADPDAVEMAAAPLPWWKWLLLIYPAIGLCAWVVLLLLTAHGYFFKSHEEVWPAWTGNLGVQLIMAAVALPMCLLFWPLLVLGRWRE